MEVHRYDSAPMWWDDLRPTVNRLTPKSAMEKTGAWKPEKTEPRFPPLPTLPWKSRRQRAIPTFPARRRRFVFSNPKRRRRLTPPKPKPDRSHVNQTGHLDLLTTVVGEACPWSEAVGDKPLFLGRTCGWNTSMEST